MKTLLSRWSEIVGQEIANATRPLAFTREKALRLLVVADSSVTPRAASGHISPRTHQSGDSIKRDP